MLPLLWKEQSRPHKNTFFFALANHTNLPSFGTMLRYYFWMKPKTCYFQASFKCILQILKTLSRNLTAWNNNCFEHNVSENQVGFFFYNLYFWKLLAYVYLHNITYIWVTPNGRIANTDMLALCASQLSGEEAQTSGKGLENIYELRISQTGFAAPVWAVQSMRLVGFASVPDNHRVTWGCPTQEALPCTINKGSS